MKAHYLVVAVITSMIFIAEMRVSAQASPCDAPEVAVPGNPQYNQLVCDAARAFDQNDYVAAAQYFEHALDLMILEAPNFLPYPRLAIVYWRMGEKERARRVLEKARISLSLVTGLFKCVRSNSFFEIRDSDNLQLKSPLAEKMSRVMCAGSHGIYGFISLNTLYRYRDLIDLYMKARAEIEGEPCYLTFC